MNTLYKFRASEVLDSHIDVLSETGKVHDRFPLLHGYTFETAVEEYCQDLWGKGRGHIVHGPYPTAYEVVVKEG